MFNRPKRVLAQQPSSTEQPSLSPTNPSTAAAQEKSTGCCPWWRSKKTEASVVPRVDVSTDGVIQSPSTASPRPRGCFTNLKNQVLKRFSKESAYSKVDTEKTASKKSWNFFTGCCKLSESTKRILKDAAVAAAICILASAFAGAVVAATIFTGGAFGIVFLAVAAAVATGAIVWSISNQKAQEPRQAPNYYSNYSYYPYPASNAV